MTSSKQRSVIAWINPSYIWVVISHPQYIECLNLIKARWTYSHCDGNWKGTLFSWLYIFYAHLAFEIWALCMLLITYGHLYHLYYTPCFNRWVLFGSLVPTMCNQTSCSQVHELLQSHCGDKGTLLPVNSWPDSSVD